MASKEDSLAAIKSWFEDEPPTADEVERGDDTTHIYARGMVDLHLSIFAYDGDKDMDVLRREVWEEIFPSPAPEPLEITGEEFSARWASATSEQIDKITAYAESILGKPDTLG